MKFVLYDDGRPGLLRDDGVVDISGVTGPLGASSGQAAMEAIITNIDDMRADLTCLQTEGSAVPLSSVKLQSPLPRPNKVLCMGGNYREFGHREASPMWGFLKDSDSVIGPGDTVVLPPDDINIFHHEAELVLVFGKAGSGVSQADAMGHVFGSAEASRLLFGSAKIVMRDPDSGAIFAGADFRRYGYAIGL